MHWVIQDNIYNEEGFKYLINVLDRLQIDYTIVKVRHFIGTIEPDVNPPNPVIVMGAYSMWKTAKKKKWIPGAFVNENFTYPKFIKHYGDFMLNKDVNITTLENVEHRYDQFFLKPCKDSKVFAGQVMDWKEFNEWRDRVLSLGWEGTVTGNTCVVQAPVAEIYREYRFFVVNGKVITGSQYRVGYRVFSTPCHEQDVIDFAQKMIDIWSPDIGCAIDIALTPDGFKVIEINCLNAAGFYACDMGKVVYALEELYK